MTGWTDIPRHFYTSKKRRRNKVPQNTSGSRYQGVTCAKEADQSFTPSGQPYENEDWPSLVIETGLSESESQLRADAHWWFVNSRYQVKMVVLLYIQRNPDCRFNIRLYQLPPTTSRGIRALNAEAERTLLRDFAFSQTVSPTVS